MPDLGKAGDQMMQFIFSHQGTARSQIIVGPKKGVDCSVLRISSNRVLVLSSDPISFIPSLGPEDSAWLSVHGLASDIATSGLLPEYALFDLNLPLRMSDPILKRYWRSVHRSCVELDVGILGGHTGRFEGCDYTIVGAGVMLATANSQQYVTAAMAQDGDDLIATKSAAIETTAVLARSFPDYVKRKLGSETQRRAAALVPNISTVKDAIMSAKVGLHENGVTAMHDVTEGGIVSAILDIVEASRLAAAIDRNAIPIYEEVREVCRLFRIDPLSSLGQGCLLIASRPQRTSRILSKLNANGIDARVIGGLAKEGRESIITDGRKKRRLTRPQVDAYWKAYWTAIRDNLA